MQRKAAHQAVSLAARDRVNLGVTSSPLPDAYLTVILRSDATSALAALLVIGLALIASFHLGEQGDLRRGSRR